ncbi:hypothetical protein VNO80_06157 [Phaseolus coccineus]|uniref:Uncharacterized protein n=1 Tax=Phaseolus coccineus TaxID=3886 RepID=A0AAN9RIG8_PHACN
MWLTSEAGSLSKSDKMTSGPDFIFKEDGAVAAGEDRRSWSEVSVHWRSRSKSLPLSFTAERKQNRITRRRHVSAGVVVS